MNSLTLKNILKEIASVADNICQKGWAEGNAGNISCNITEFIDKKINHRKYEVYDFLQPYRNLNEKFILTTATGIKMRELVLDTASCMLIIYIFNYGKSYIVLNYNDIFNRKNIKKSKNLNPTSELPSHLAIHNFLIKTNRKEKFVLHTHPTEVIALTQIKKFTKEININNLLWKTHPEMKIFLPDGVGFIPYCTPGSNKIAELSVKSIKNHKAIIWEKHGCLAISDSISTCFDIIDLITKAIKIFFICKSAGFELEGLKESELRRLNENK